MLEYAQAKKVLDEYGIRSVESAYVGAADEAVAFSDGDRIVLKLISDKAVHKTKEGLVKLDLKGEDEISAAFRYLEDRGRKLRPYKILAQKMAESGVEIIIGGNTDAQFGRMLLIGLGGIYVETFKDVELRLCPITKADAKNMLESLRSGKVITHGGASTKMVANLLFSVSKLLIEHEEISELDLNPVIVREGSYDVVDIRMIK
ncbi:Acetate--CoA ligase [ADP-forming] I [uncultured archaeon]|nr:Acetate--CoA ligase [ADP-forming] I [uncultured archaeon]